MDRIWNKAIILTLCIFLHMQYESSYYRILPFLVCFMLSMLHDLVTIRIRYVMMMFYLILCFFFPPFLCYTPLMLYDMFSRSTWYVIFLFALPYLVIMMTGITSWQVMMLVFCIIACVLKDQQVRNNALFATYRLQRDSTKEVTLLLKEKNRDLLIQQTYEIQVATLDERNRIAREIHDNVGHLLSSSLLQVGALQAISKEDTLQEPLTTLRSTLSTAMDAIRSSVHDLHEDAIQLDVELQKIIKEFTFCKVEFNYTMEQKVPKELKYHILAIIKEALHNVMKHSNATRVLLTLHEQPSFYQLIIEDNGTKLPVQQDGIGLQNIQQRVALYKGYMNIQKEKGFRIFITIPKEEVL